MFVRKNVLLSVGKLFVQDYEIIPDFEMIPTSISGSETKQARKEDMTTRREGSQGSPGNSQGGKRILKGVVGVPLVLRGFGTIDPVGVFYPAGSVLRVFEGRLRDRILRLRADLTCFCGGSLG